MRYQISGGAGPYEAAAIVAAIARIMEEQAAAASSPRSRPQQSAWVMAIEEDQEFDDELFRHSASEQ